jgi:hypothetical protein
MDMQESLSNQQSTSPWQQLLLPIHPILESILQDLQQMQRREHELEKRLNTKNASPSLKYSKELNKLSKISSWKR